MKKKSTIKWIAEFASIHKKTYVFSVIFAVLGVFCALTPYFLIGNMVKELLNGRTEFSYYLNQCLWLALFWTARVLFHAASTTLSHKATFHVLSTIRQRVCDKLYKLPLGYVCDTPSGSIKNVIVERIDSIETTLAHILPEFTGNLLGPVLVIIYLFTIDRRMALLSLVTIPIGLACYMGMCIGYEESYKNTIVKTKALNDTAVEYINGIEVIKAFGKAESSYEKFVVALHGITMNMKEGTVNALVGPSGSGKSTIAKLIAGLWDVKEGAVSIGGVDIREMPLEEQNRMIAYVSQENYLFDMTVRENIRMGNPKATDKEVEQVAKASGCYDFIMQLENGFDTVVGGAGGHLSGGERQRISIARAMLKNAEIIILDEATAYTDPENEAIVQSAVAKLVQGKTLLVIAHRLSTITNSDCIFVINGGEVSASGTHDELLKNSKLYKNMWESHISVKDRIEKGDEVCA
ncbi:MAG: ABC transporter ATP-binding protein [Lachnospiraceae bacterium]|nr:ABC transporter ATP-binding protein [Lachnospiraceae bacterium]